ESVRVRSNARKRLRLLLLHDHAAGGVDEHVVAVLVLAGTDVVVLALRLDAHDLAAGQTLERDHRGQVLPGCCVVGGERRHGRDSDQYCEHGLFAHGFSALNYDIAANLTRSERIAQIASREDASAAAREGSLSCSSESTLSINRLNGRRRSSSVGSSLP